jgi:serine/threonine protein kinase/formylglycine-generating enzyme required for sulfatase activity
LPVNIPKEAHFAQMAESIEFEHYRLLQNRDGSLVELGRGAMGITYKAFDKNLRCDVALKVISDRLLEDSLAAGRFLREARSAAKLRHRNVASIYHLGQHGSSYFYAMEFIDGETVTARVKREGPLSCLVALDIAQQVASALIAAEAQHLVHRDIKPSNLMLVLEGDGEMIVKVIDFGLAKSILIQSSAAITSSGFVGTPYFASPEQLDRQAEDIRSDIYSLGVTLWFMLTGKPTFIGSVASVIAQHLDRTPPFDDLAILPSEVVAVLRRMLEKDRATRIQTAVALRGELKACIERLQSGQRPEESSISGEVNFETIGLSVTPRSASLPAPGELIKSRYRLIEDLDPENPRHTFYGQDDHTRTRVGLRLFRLPEAVLAQLKEEAKRIQAVSHPNFLKVFTVEREDSYCFAVFEWLDGFPLSDLLRVRRTLTLRETCLLLKQIAPALDAALAADLGLEINLGRIMVHFPEGFGEPSEDLILRCPLDEWPAFVIKLDALGRASEPDDTITGDQPVIGEGTRIERGVIRVGLLVYELLGGKPGGVTPLPNASEEENRVLRRSLTPGHGFATAVEFYETLSTLSENRPLEAKRAAIQPSNPEPDRPVQTLVRPIANDGPASGRTVPGSEEHTKGSYRWVYFLLPMIVCAVAGWGLVSKWLTPPPQHTITKATPTATAKAKAALRNLAPLVTGKPWSNSLEMKFVSIGQNHFAVWQTRVRDFAEFVQETGYDAAGGMSSVVTQNGFRLNSLSWKQPGFVQTLDDPVVGVSWEDAGQFCDWLTRRERAEGILSAFQRYRLPTDAEWSFAIGLTRESGVTPEERSGGVKNVYPWGNRFPPPNDFANYAGIESRTGAPQNWPVIAGYHDVYARTGPVSAFAPNQNGVSSLGGNVWEWCQDKYQNGLNWRTLRGGSWATSRAEETLSSYRRGYDPYFRSDDVGFRCVIASDGEHE